MAFNVNVCNALQRFRVLVAKQLSSRGLIFEQPEMEAQFKTKESQYVSSFTRTWILFHFLINVVAFPLRCNKYSLFSKLDFAFLVQFTPFGVVFLLFFAMHIPFLKPWTYQWLCLANVVMVAWTAWSVHLFANLDDNLEETTTLRDVFGALQHSVSATTQLHTYVVRESSRKILWYGVIMDFLLLDMLQFLGLTIESFFVFSSPFLSFLGLTLVSCLMPKDVLEVLVTCAVIFVYNIFTSLHVSKNRRRQFRLDRELQISLENEAEALKEAAQQEEALKKASQEADTILNHLLKNVMADAAGCVHLYLQSLACALHSGATPPADLVQATECLERGVAWCRKRQALLRIASGKYFPQRGEVDLAEFGHSLLQGRPIQADFPAVTATFDPLLCEIILENALTNACRHCHPARPSLRFSAHLTPLPGASDKDEGPARQRLTFVVLNRANPARPPITPELVTRLLQGEELPLGPGAPRLSEHLGMQHLCQAARVHNATLQMSQTGDVVRFEVSLEVTVRQDSVSLYCMTPLPPPMVPPGLRVFCIDDSPVARRLLVHTLSKEPFNAKVFAFGQTAEDVPHFLEQATQQADIVVLDYHLDYGHTNYLGTDLLRELLRRGYTGLVCMRSANATPYDEAMYARAGAHCCIGKDVHPQAMTAALMAAYLELDRSSQAMHCLRMDGLETDTRSTQCSSPSINLPGTIGDFDLTHSSVNLPLLAGNLGQKGGTTGDLQLPRCVTVASRCVAERNGRPTSGRASMAVPFPFGACLPPRPART